MPQNLILNGFIDLQVQTCILDNRKSQMNQEVFEGAHGRLWRCAGTSEVLRSRLRTRQVSLNQPEPTSVSNSLFNMHLYGQYSLRNKSYSKYTVGTCKNSLTDANERDRCRYILSWVEGQGNVSGYNMTLLPMYPHSMVVEVSFPKVCHKPFPRPIIDSIAILLVWRSSSNEADWVIHGPMMWNHQNCEKL